MAGAGTTICDIGAYEAQSVTAQCEAGGQASVNGSALQAAVDAAQAGATISITKGPCVGAWRGGDEYQLIRTTKNVTLTTHLASATLDAGGKGRVLTAAGGTTNVTGPNLTLKNGVAGSGGGVRVLPAAGVVISGTKISDNTAAVSGGGLAAAGGQAGTASLTIRNTTVQGNKNGAQVLAWDVGPSRDFRDSSPYQNHGWCFNSNTNGNDCPVVEKLGDYYGLKFQAKQPIRVPSSDSLNLSASMTLAAWVYVPSSPSGDGKVLGKVEGTPPNARGYVLSVYHNAVSVEVWDANSGHKTLYPSGSIPANTWTHIAATYRTGGKLTVYVNGVIPASNGQTSASSLPIGTGTSDFVIGAAPWDPNQYKLTGTVRSVRVYDRELTGTEIGLLMNGTLDEANLTGGGEGGGLFVGPASNVVVEESALAGNSAGGGGGIFQLDGTFTGRNLTVSGNTGLWSGGGLWHAGGTADLRFLTITQNKTSADAGPKAANVHNSATGLTLEATIVTQPSGGSGRTNCFYSAGIVSGGYNRTDDASCAALNQATDVNNQLVPLGELADNGGPTLTHKLLVDPNAVDQIPKNECQSQLSPSAAIDQRLRARPRLGIRPDGDTETNPDNWRCDIGAFELGIEKHRVCGPPLYVKTEGGKIVWAPGAESICDLTSIAAALNESQPDDTIVVNGVVTETVTIAKNVTIRGPVEEQTPAWHLGIVQAATSAPTGQHNRAPIFTIAAGVTASIENLNLRHGDAPSGGAILNNGTLTVKQSTLYANDALDGAAIYSTGPKLTLTNSTVISNTAGTGNAAIAGTGDIVARYNTFQANGSLHLSKASSAVGNILVGQPDQVVCSGVAAGDYNLYDGAKACTTGAHDKTGDAATGLPSGQRRRHAHRLPCTVRRRHGGR